MYARAGRLAVAALPLLLAACAGVVPRPDAAARPQAGSAAAASHELVVPHHAFEVPPPDFEADWSTPRVDPFDEEAGPVTGRVSWYGKRFAGRRTASGERFDPKALTMAHRELPFGTRVRVTNPENGRSVVVRVNDRGPFVGARIADLSHEAARRLGMVHDGVIVAELEVLHDDERLGGAEPGAAGESREPRATVDPRGAGGPTELASSK